MNILSCAVVKEKEEEKRGRERLDKKYFKNKEKTSAREEERRGKYYLHGDFRLLCINCSQALMSSLIAYMYGCSKRGERRGGKSERDEKEEAGEEEAW